MQLPRIIAPQLLTAAPAPPEGERWLHEVKYDGYRLHCRIDGGRAALITRGGHDWTPKLRRIAEAVEALGIERAYLDGEVVALDAAGMPDFTALHAAMRGGRSAPRLAYQVFDVLHAGRSLLDVELIERKEILRALVAGRCETVRFCDHLLGDGPALHRHAHAAGLEGIVSKRVSSRYRPGIRSRDWLKVKCWHPYRFTVTAVLEDAVAVAASDGKPAGSVPVYSRRQLALLKRGMEIEVKAIAWTPGRALRHAMITGPAAVLPPTAARSRPVARA
jgi:bifunctional non-homologous end joining protein LigD